MKNQLLLFLWFALAFWLVQRHVSRPDQPSVFPPARVSVLPAPQPATLPAPENPYARPISEEIYCSLTAWKLARQDATDLSAMYARQAALVRSNVGDWQTDELRDSVVQDGRSVGLQGRYSGFSAVVDQVFAEHLELRVRPVTAADAAFLEGLAWQIWELGHD